MTATELEDRWKEPKDPLFFNLLIAPLIERTIEIMAKHPLKPKKPRK